MKKLIALFLAFGVSSAAAQSVQRSGKVKPGHVATGISETNLGWINAQAAPYNAQGNGTTDDTAAIQAAIDAAFAAGIQTIYLPKASVCYKTTAPIYLDPPGNLRSSFNNPPIAAFSMALIGEPGQGNHESSFGSKICAGAGYPVLYVGTGQGMKVSNISIVGSGGLKAAAYRCGRIPGNPPEAGIYIAGGGGGSSRALVEQVWIENVYYGISVGLNNGGLGDSNTFHKITVNNSCVGIIHGSNQNFINDCIDCNIYGSGTALDSRQGVGMTVVGGNWSATNGKAVGVMTLSRYSAITTTIIPGTNNYAYTFSATLGAPAFRNVTGYQYGDVVSSGGQVWFCISPSCTGTTPSLSVPSAWEPIANYMPILNAWAIVTSHYGVIPMTVTSFTQATGSISFQVWNPWSEFYWPQTNAVTSADLTNEIQSQSAVYAAEWVTVFAGAGINATGVHIENPSVPTQLFFSQTFLNGSAGDTFNQIRCNFNPTKVGSLTGTPAQKAQYYVTQSFPQITISNTPLTINSSNLLGSGFEPFTIDVNLFQGSQQNLVSDSNTQGFGPLAMRAYSNATGPGNQNFGNGSGGLGVGLFFGSPFGPVNQGNPGTGGDGPQMRNNWGISPFMGVRPAPYSHPCITPAQLSVLSGALPAWNNTNPGGSGGISFGYPFIYGGQLYAICDWYVGRQSHYLFESTHHFYSMGQNITTTNVPGLNWSYKGGSSWVYADQQTLSLMFPGLGIILNDGSADHQYLVTGVYLPLGYFTVVLGDNPNGGGLSGGKTSIITGNLIKQEPYKFVFP